MPYIHPLPFFLCSFLITSLTFLPGDLISHCNWLLTWQSGAYHYTHTSSLSLTLYLSLCHIHYFFLSWYLSLQAFPDLSYLSFSEFLSKTNHLKLRGYFLKASAFLALNLFPNELYFMSSSSLHYSFNIANNINTSYVDSSEM